MRMNFQAGLLLAGFVALASCSDVKKSDDQEKSACSADQTFEICRELTPGEFKLDRASDCDGTRVPAENEVPLSFCRPCQERTAGIRDEVAKVTAEAGTCKTSDDCAVYEVTPSCEYGCGLVSHKGFDTTRLNELTNELNACTTCAPKSCVRSFVPPTLVCDKGRCVSQ